MKGSSFARNGSTRVRQRSINGSVPTARWIKSKSLRAIAAYGEPSLEQATMES
jgi:hypothetical protein